MDNVKELTNDEMRDLVVKMVNDNKAVVMAGPIMVIYHYGGNFNAVSNLPEELQPQFLSDFLRVSADPDYEHVVETTPGPGKEH